MKNNETIEQGKKYLMARDINPKSVIEQALTEPGTINGCYSLFRDYSTGNVAAFSNQLRKLGLPVSPVMAGGQWVKKGYIDEKKRQSMRSSMLYGLMPQTFTFPKKDENGNIEKDENGNVKTKTITRFKVERYWLASSQLNIKVKQDYKLMFDEFATLDRLGLSMIEWDKIDGNCQGYAIPNEKVIAINPLCTKRLDTFLHEVAHCLLHTSENKIVDGSTLDRSIKEVEAELTSYICMVMLGVDNEKMLSDARGYIQNWLGSNKFNNFTRVYNAVDIIMKSIVNHKGNFKVTSKDLNKIK